MAKPDWGEKRECAGCGARYYDLGKPPPQCPKCGAEFRPPARSGGGARAAAPVEAKPVAAAKPKAAAPEDELVADDDEDDDDDPDEVLDVNEDEEK